VLTNITAWLFNAGGFIGALFKVKASSALLILFSIPFLVAGGASHILGEAWQPAASGTIKHKAQQGKESRIRTGSAPGADDAPSQGNNKKL
jgi:hypothetical protein